MCARFSLKARPGDLEKVFGTLPPGYRPRYNIAPTQEVLAVVGEEAGPRARFLRWGLIPFWADDPSIGNRMVNARVETVHEKPAYRNAFARRRCLVLADGFYEWQAREDGKHPMRVQMPGAEPFAFAGLWEVWERHGRRIESCTILTRAANAFIAPIHDRMPVILDEAGRGAWMDGAAGREDLLALLRDAVPPELEAYEVSTLVNNPHNDVEDCLTPAL